MAINASLLPLPIADSLHAPACTDSTELARMHVLQDGDVEAAQEQKSRLEQLQRSDQALRGAGRRATQS